MIRLNPSIVTVLISFIGVGKVFAQEGFGQPVVCTNNSENAAVVELRMVDVVKFDPSTQVIVHNTNCSTTVTFDGRLQIAIEVNAAWREINLESRTVFTAEKATGFFRTVR